MRATLLSNQSGRGQDGPTRKKGKLRKIPPKGTAVAEVVYPARL